MPVQGDALVSEGQTGYLLILPVHLPTSGQILEQIAGPDQHR